MKKIITMVGTSLFENYLEKSNDKDFGNHIESLRGRSASEYGDESMRIKIIRKKITEWLEKLSPNTNASAEIKSLVKLKEELKDDFGVYLLSSDTILSRLAGEILKETFLPQLNFNRIEHQCIEDLQVQNKEKFIDGIRNLIIKIYRIANYYWGNVVINITGGYKATIPYLSILAQINKCPIYYIFEETDALIKIPYIPLDINWRVFEENEKFFMELEREEIKEFSSDVKYREEIESLIERVNNLISLNPLGIALWEKYKERFNIFLISESVDGYINQIDKKHKVICERSFLELKRRLREDPNSPDLNHGLRGLDLREFKCFKHKEEDIQVRILYKVEEYETRYGSKEMHIYISSIAIGNEVHNAGSSAEYVEKFDKEIQSGKIRDFEKYKIYKI